MSDDFGSYWSRFLRRRYDRRAVLRRIALGGAGLAGGAALACNNRPGPVSKAAQTQVSKGGTASSLVGRTGSPAPAGETPVRGGIYVNASGGNPQGFDPQSNSGLSTLTVTGGVMSKLLQPKTSWDLNEVNNKATAPDLAVTLESSGAITWTAKLRPGARFHNIAPRQRSRRRGRGHPH